MAAWKARVSGSSCVRRRSSTGVRSAPPPNQGFVVTTKRVFMWTVGTFGFHGWAMSEMPAAKKRGSSSEPGIWPRNSGSNSPWTVETWTPDLLEDAPVHHRHDAAAAPRGRHGPCAPRACARSGRAAVASGKNGSGRLVFERFEGGADPVPQGGEPGGRFGLEALDRRWINGHLQTCVVMGVSGRQPCAEKARKALGLAQAPRPGSSPPPPRC